VNPKSPNRVKVGDAMPICVAPSIVTRRQASAGAGHTGSYGILQTQVQAVVQYIDFGCPCSRRSRRRARA